MTDIIPFSADLFIALIHFELGSSLIKPGEDLEFTFTLQNAADTPVRLDVRYEIVLSAGDGAENRRTYQIARRKCPSGFLLYNRRHTISEEMLPSCRAPVSVPGLLPFPGAHIFSGQLRILVNGQILHTADFRLSA